MKKRELIETLKKENELLFAEIQHLEVKHQDLKEKSAQVISKYFSLHDETITIAESEIKRLNVILHYYETKFLK